MLYSQLYTLTKRQKNSDSIFNRFIFVYFSFYKNCRSIIMFLFKSGMSFYPLYKANFFKKYQVI